MTGWADGRMLGLDTETTGVDPETVRIVTATTVYVGAGLATDTLHLLVDPGVEIPADATAVHGITTDHARAHGCPPAEAVGIITSVLTDAWGYGMPVVAMNACYDLTVLDREARRHLGQPIEIQGPVLDPLVLDRHLDPYRKGSRKLADLAQHYRVALDGAHDSTQDALAAARIVWRQARQHPEIAGMSLQDLHRLQVAAHGLWAQGYRSWLQKRGQFTDGHDLDGAWPMRPYRQAAEVSA
jgi:DNA polymerase III subunit epsilon